MILPTWPLTVSIAALVVSAAVLGFAGTRLAKLVDRLADRTGWGEAVAGAILLGASTSLPGLVTTVLAASAGEAELAVSNAVGGIAAQTMFLALADMALRHVNLEHAAASAPNMLQSVVLIALVALVLIGPDTPDVTVLGVHPLTALLIAGYGYGMHLTRATTRSPMWEPTMTRDTAPDVPEEVEGEDPLSKMLVRFAGLAALVGLTGAAVAQAGLSIVASTGASGTLVGGLFTSVVTSLPELVTVFAAVRVGALTLAIGDIVGGNTFDILFVAAADIAFGGSIYHAIGDDTRFLLALTVLLTSLLTAGLIHRQRRGIGFEGFAILVCYAAGFAIIATT